MKRKIAALLSFCFVFSNLIGQNPPEFVPGLSDPSNNVLPGTPNAQAFQKYADIPVGYHTGVPNVSIPLYVVNGGSISVPISLSYHSSGVRVNDISNWVGLGWNLNAGGMVSRTIMNLADEIYLYNHKIENPLTNVPSDEWLQYVGNWNGNPDPSKDGQHDVFNFNFNDYSGKFIIDNEQIVLISQQDLVISYEMGQSPNSLFTEFKKFTIVDPQGVQYKFGNGFIEYSKMEGGCNSSGMITPNRSHIYPTGWMLYEIYDPKTNDKIILNYSPSTLNYDAGGSKTKMWGKQFGSPNTAYYCAGRNQDVICSYSKLETSYTLNSIIGSGGRIEVDNIGKRPDMNLGNQRLESITCYDRKNALVKSFEFTQSFGSSEQQNNSFVVGNTKHMFLLSVKEKDANNNALPPYEFSYKNQNNLPKRFSNGQDHWGYYNGKSSSQSPFPWVSSMDPWFEYSFGDKEPNAEKMKYGVLEKIIYPTGGETNFQYEPNTYFYNANLDVQVEKNYNLSSIIQESDDLDIEDIGTFTSENGIAKCTKTFTPAFNQDVDFSYLIRKTTKENGIAYIYLKNGGTIIKTWSVDDPLLLPPYTNACYELREKTGNETVSLTGGQSYTLELTSKYVCPSGSEIATINFNVIEQKSQYLKNRMCGGIRVSKITFKENPNSTEILTKRFVYSKKQPIDLTNQIISSNINSINTDLDGSGVLVGSFPNYLNIGTYKNFYNTSPTAGQTYMNVVACDSVLESCSEITNTKCYYYILNTNATNPLTSNAGNTVLYSKVYELQGNESYNGLNEFNFNIVPDVDGLPIEKAYCGPQLISPKIDNSWLSGNLTSKKLYRINSDKTFTIKQKEEYSYLNNFSNLNIAHPTNYVYDVVCAFDSELFYLTYQCENTPTMYGAKAYFTPIASGFNPQIQKKITLYDDNGSIVENTSKTEFNSIYHHMPTKQTTLSQGGIEQSQYFTYAPDVYHGQFTGTLASTPEGIALVDMHEKHNLSAIVEFKATQKFPTLNASTLAYDFTNKEEKLLTAANIIYTDNTHRPSGFFKTEYLTPQILTDYENVHFNSLFGYEKETDLRKQKEFEYNSTGNIISAKANDNVNSTFVWKPYGNAFNGTYYGSRIPVAQVVNANPNQVRYLSYEDEEYPSDLTQNQNGRTLATNTGTDKAKSGNYYYNLTALDNKVDIKQLPVGKYVVSCWYKPIDYARKPEFKAPLPAGATWYYSVNDYANNKDANGWAYSEMVIDLSTQTTPQDITLYYTGGAGNFFIDELRVHPLDAQMTTYGYNNNMQVNQIFDVNGIPIQYDYDTYQRLLSIRDQDLNILKSYQYNYKPH